MVGESKNPMSPFPPLKAAEFLKNRLRFILMGNFSSHKWKFFGNGLLKNLFLKRKLNAWKKKNPLIPPSKAQNVDMRRTLVTNPVNPTSAYGRHGKAGSTDGLGHRGNGLACPWWALAALPKLRTLATMEWSLLTFALNTKHFLGSWNTNWQPPPTRAFPHKHTLQSQTWWAETTSSPQFPPQTWGTGRRHK